MYWHCTIECVYAYIIGDAVQHTGAIPTASSLFVSAEAWQKLS